MTPKEKAQELFDKMDNISLTTYAAQQCALIAVDEIIEATKTEIDRPDYNGVVLAKYWQEVKTEIKSL